MKSLPPASRAASEPLAPRQVQDCLRALQHTSSLGFHNLAFDESSTFLIYPSMLGMKLFDLVKGKAATLRTSIELEEGGQTMTVDEPVPILGRVEGSERFVGCFLFQGPPIKRPVGRSEFLVKQQEAEAKQAGGGAGAAQANGESAPPSPNPALDRRSDPTVFATSFRRNRFFLFSRREPDQDSIYAIDGLGRDVFNERTTEHLGARQAEAAAGNAGKSAGSAGSAVPTAATIVTSFGDIPIELFSDPQSGTPKTVENFVGLARRGYFDGITFHRVIRDFMIQTGDPTATGTGGESIWGRPFADEIRRNLKFDRPFTVGMANAGPGTNGSQFFITVSGPPKTSNLDGKHTVFGRVKAGSEGEKVATQISQVPTDRTPTGRDKPYQDVKILKVIVS